MTLQDSDPEPEYCALPKCLDLGFDKYRCARCKTTYYCSLRHQLEDVLRHEAQCRPPTPPPVSQAGLHSHSVLLFPTDEDAPRIVQLECRTGAESQMPGERDHHIHLASLLGENPYSWTLVPVGSIEPTTPPTRLYLAFNDGPSMGHLPNNRPAQRLTAGHSHPVEWRGTLVGYRLREPGSLVTQFLDVSMSDLPAFTAYLKEHGTPVHPLGSGPAQAQPRDVAEMLPQSEMHSHAEPVEKSSENTATNANQDHKDPMAIAAERLANNREGEPRRLLLTAVVAAIAAYGAFYYAVFPTIDLLGRALRSLPDVLGLS
ncbi:hypothetical protein BV20DRAFT_14689 [Pilatotrama ljubarskyi]|nr:hypothetical protein BV20DRAFT_14689 [Pilatotrama ljubarskyi]